MPKDTMDDFDPQEMKNILGELNTGVEELRKKNEERFKEIEKHNWDDVVTREEMKKISDSIDANQESLDKFQARLNTIARFGDGGEKGESAEALDKKAAHWARIRSVIGKTSVPENFGHEELKNYEDAFGQYLRAKDEKMLGADELKALRVGSDPDGGYTVHPSMEGRIVKKIYETSPIGQYAATQEISTDELRGILDNDEASAGWVTETGSRSETDTPQLGNWRIPVHELYANPAITAQLRDDSAVDIEMWLGDKVADKMARIENAAFVTGDGVGKPRGFATYPDGTAWGQIERVVTTADGAFDAAPDGADAFITAFYKLKPQYQTNAIFAMNGVTMSKVRLLKDSDGAYIWAPGMSLAQPATILGKPAVRFEDMASVTTTGALAVAVGDFGQAYQIVRRQGTRVLIDPYSNKPYIHYYTTRRVGGDVVNFEALKFIEASAS